MAQSWNRVKVVFLGTGTSHGVPMIGCDCPVCTSTDPRDQRSRPSIVVQANGKSLLIDTAPELRLQCIRNCIDRVDAVLFTHAHADHVAGMDDLRRFNWINGGPMDCFGTAPTLESIRRMFAYIFIDQPDYPSHKPALNLHEIGDAAFELFDLPIVPIPMFHGTLPVLGFRFGPVAYCTDCSLIPPQSLERLSGLEVLILDALRKRPHPTHFNIEQAVEMAARIGASQTLFTHIAHELGHAETNATLPETIALAYDGQIVEVGA